MWTSKQNIYENVYDGTTNKFKSYRLHLNWKGSVFKLIWHKILVWLVAYSILQLIYWFVLVQNEKGQLWKLEGTNLTNKEGLWKSDDPWKFNFDGKFVNVVNIKKNEVLGIGKFDNSTVEASGFGQNWKNGSVDNEGYFVLINQISGQALTASENDTLKTEKNQQAVKQEFEKFCAYCLRFSQYLPIVFILGFFVSTIVSRWWDQFCSLPNPEQIAMKVVNFLPAKDEKTANLRRTVMRYVNLSTILVYRLVSENVKERFPDYESLIESKLMLPNEVERLKKIDEKTPHESTMMPILWAKKLLTRHAVYEKNVVTSKLLGVGYLSMIQPGLDEYLAGNRKVLNFSWANFPLAYTQVVIMTVYFYFLAALFSRQHLDSDKVNFILPLYAPFFTMIELFCYLGLAKVAETLLNPFGNDDEDFEVNYIIDRNLQMSYLIVDQDGTQKEDTIDPFPQDEIPDLSQTYEKDIPIITLESPTEKGTEE